MSETSEQQEAWEALLGLGLAPDDIWRRYGEHVVKAGQGSLSFVAWMKRQAQPKKPVYT